MAKSQAKAQTKQHGVNPKIAEQGNAVKDPKDWVTGDEPITGAQASYLKTLCEETGQEFDPGLSKGDASTMIDELRAKDPRLAGK